MQSTRLPHPQARERLPLLALAALVALAAALRFWHLGHQSFWYDESLTVEEARVSFGAMLSAVVHHEITPPLFFAGEWVSAHLLGTDEVALRLLSAVAGVATVPLVYLAGRWLAGTRAGLIAAGLAACNPLLVWYSQEARSYSLLVMLCAGSLAALARTQTARRSRTVWVWAIVSALALATHFFAGFLVAPEAVWMWIHGQPRRVARRAVLAVVLVQALLAPLALVRNGHGTNWIAGIRLSHRLPQLVSQFAGGYGTALWSPRTVALVICGLLALAAVGLADRMAARRLLFAVTVVSLALPLALIAVGQDLVVTRNVIATIVPLTVLMGAGLAAPRTRLPGALLAGSICALGVAATLAVANQPRLQKPGWHAVAVALGRPAQPRLVIAAGWYRAKPLTLYLRGARIIHTQRVRVGEVDLVGARTPYVPGCWWGALCNLPDSQPTHALGIRGIVAAGTRATGPFTIIRYLAPHGVHVSGRWLERHGARIFHERRPGHVLGLYQAPATVRRGRAAPAGAALAPHR